MPAAKKKAYDTTWASKKATEAAMKRFEEQFGREMGFEAVRSDAIEPIEVIPTGTIALDYALGIGGLPCGAVCEVWGPEHAGKTTTLMRVVAEAQKKFPDKMTAWVDMEQTFDKKWAAANGVDLKRLWLIENPKTAEDVADATRRFVESGLCSIVVLDSVGGMIAKKELEKEADEATIGLVAKVVTRMVKACSAMGKSNGTTTVVVNQVRANIGNYGGDQTTGGGWALKHITTIKIKISRGGSLPKTITEDGVAVPVGYEVTAKIEKNKRAPYGKVATWWLFNQTTDKYGPVGVDIATEALDFGVKLGVIAGKGTAWLTFPNGERFNGAEKARDYLYEHPEVVSEIREQVLAQIASKVYVEEADDAAAQSMADFMAEQQQESA